MYYKIENTECEVYKKLHNMRSDELLWGEQNKQAITEKTGLKWEGYLGHGGQQNFNRVPDYSGFKFSEPEKVNLNTWKRHPQHSEVFVPNGRTKTGKAMNEFLRNGLKGGSFLKVHDALRIETLGRFTFPYVEIAGDKLVLFIDDQFELTDPNIIEITKREFNELLKAAA